MLWSEHICLMWHGAPLGRKLQKVEGRVTKENYSLSIACLPTY